MENKSKIKASETLIQSLIDKNIYFDSFHITVPVGTTFENKVFEYETNKKFDAIIGFGIAATYKYIAGTNFNHVYLKIQNEETTLFNKANIRVWLQDQTYLNKDMYFRPVFSPASGKKINFIIDATNPGGSAIDSEIQVIIFYKNNAIPYPYEIDFHSSQILVPYSPTISANYSNPIIQQFDLEINPKSFNEIIGFNLVGGSKLPSDSEIDLIKCDIALTCEGKYLMDFLPILYFRTYNYSKSNERTLMYMFKDLNLCFFPLYRDGMANKKISLLIKHYAPSHTSAVDLYQDAIFLMRRKAQRYL